MSTTTIDLDEKTYGQLLGRTLPHVIHTNEECERLTNELLRLDERDSPSPEEKELAELLTVLVDEYEERRYPIRTGGWPRDTSVHFRLALENTEGAPGSLFEPGSCGCFFSHSSHQSPRGGRQRLNVTR